MIHLDPKPLDLNKFRANPTIVLVAKRGSGKSTCIKNLMHHFDVNAHIPVGVVCSHSEDLDPFFSEFFPPAFIFNDCIKMLHKVLERQEKIKDENKKLAAEGKPTKDPRILVILDDVIDNPSFMKDEAFRTIMLNGRHYDITLIIAVQYTKSLPPNARGNFDYIFIFKNDIAAEIKKLYTEYAGIFPKESIFKAALQAFTANHQIMVIDMVTASGDLNDKFFIYKAKLNLPYNHFGSTTFNNYNDKHYNKKWKESKRGINVGLNSRDINVFYNS